MTRIGNSVNGTRYSNAGWAALYTSDATVAVTKPGENKTIARSKQFTSLHSVRKYFYPKKHSHLFEGRTPMTTCTSSTNHIMLFNTIDFLNHFLDKSHCHMGEPLS